MTIDLTIAAVISRFMCAYYKFTIQFGFQNRIRSLRWRHNDHYSVSNHQPHGCLLNRLFRRRWKKTSKLRVTGLCVGNSPGPVNSPHKGPVTRKMFPFDDVIMGESPHTHTPRQTTPRAHTYTHTHTHTQRNRNVNHITSAFSPDLRWIKYIRSCF